MTDNCDAARCFCRLFQEHIKEVAIKQGTSPDQIHIHEADCWHHLRNTWIGNVLEQLSERLAIILENVLKEISPVLRVGTEVVALL